MGRLGAVARRDGEATEGVEELDLDAIEKAANAPRVEVARELPFERMMDGEPDEPRGKTLVAVTDELLAPADMSKTKSRKGGNNKDLTYFEWNFLAEQLNRIFGFGRWSTNSVESKHVGLDPESGVPCAVESVVQISVDFPSADGRPYGHSATYTSIGVAEVRQYWDRDEKKLKPRTYQAYLLAVQASERNGFKRCCANLGNQFGLSLYGDDDADDKATESSSTTSHSSSSNTATAATSTGPVECEECGKEITAFVSKTGKSYTVTDLVKFSKRDADGHIFCYNCKQDYLGNRSK
jgi:hypothetical protein